MEERFLESRGIYYQRTAPVPGRKTLLLLHGFSSSGSVWVPFEAHLGEKYNLLVPDLRGSGKSHRYPRYRDYTIEAFVGDLHALLDHEHVSSCTIVGYSIGALIVTAFAHYHTVRVERAVLVSPPYRMHALWRMRLRLPLLYAAACAAAMLPMLGTTGRHLDYSKYKGVGDENLRRFFVELWNTGLRSYLYQVLQLLFFKNDSWWIEITAPVHLVEGTADTVIPPASAARLAAQMPHATVSYIQGGDHLLPYNHIEALAQEIDQDLGI